MTTLMSCLIFLLRLSMASVACYFSGQCVIKYFDREIGTRVDYIPTSSALSPDITICWKLGYKKNVLQRMGFESKFKILERNDREKVTDMNQFMKEARFALDEFVVNITVSTLMQFNGSYSHVLWTRLKSQDKNALFFRPLSLRDEGLCYSSMIPFHYQAAGIFLIDIFFISNGTYDMEKDVDHRSKGWKVLLHQNGQFFRTSTFEVETKPTVQNKVNVNHKLFKKIDSAVCDIDMNIGYDQCWQANINSKIERELQCIFPWTGDSLLTIDEDKICTKASDYNSNVEDKAKSEMRDPTTPSCQSPCTVVTFKATTPIETPLDQSIRNVSHIISRFGQLQIYFPEEVEVTEEFYVYDALSMVGEAGGYLGLFLGISCYQIITECINFVRNRCEPLVLKK